MDDIKNIESNPALVIADRIINSEFLTREDDLHFLIYSPADELCAGADKIRSHFCGNYISLCSIINGRSGKCSENCKFCAQSAHYCTGAEEYTFLNSSAILEDAKYHDSAGIDRYSIVTAGRTLKGKDLELALESYKMISETCHISLCASHGILDKKTFQYLRECGVSRYHANIETSRRFFPEICSTHTYEDKCRTIKLAQEAGLEVCSGGIIGMGETWDDRIDMALSLHEMNVVSIPINVLQPIPGTPFESLPPLSEEDILRTFALFRYLNPTADIRIAAGRIHLKDSGRNAFCSGANAAITGDMLTTSGNNISDDIQMIHEMGFTCKRRDS